MNFSSWQTRDYDQAFQAIQKIEEEQSPPPCLVDCGEDLLAILPVGLPALGVGLHGAMMLSPLPVFMLCLVAVPVIGFSGSWDITLLTVTVTAACMVMILGLYRAMLMLLRQRELFPRKFFCTLGPEGMTTRYSKIQLPLNPGRGSMLKKDIQAAEVIKVWFGPAFLTGCLSVPAVKVVSNSGDPLVIPTPRGGEHKVLAAVNKWRRN